MLEGELTQALREGGGDRMGWDLLQKCISFFVFFAGYDCKATQCIRGRGCRLLIFLDNL